MNVQDNQNQPNAALIAAIAIWRGALARRVEDEDNPFRPVILQARDADKTLDSSNPPLDYVLNGPDPSDDDIRKTVGRALEGYRQKHDGDPPLINFIDHGMMQVVEPCMDPQAQPLENKIALVTGAAGAIGQGICLGLLEKGCRVAVSDLAGDALDRVTEKFAADFPDRAISVPMNVTDPEAVAEGFARLCAQWGGVDIVVVNAGIAHVAKLNDLKLEDFARLEKVNVEGTLLTLAEAGRVLRRQATGGDIICVSTKNVFAPGAGFGAYSATKAASHQLARIASLELAEFGIRVNMVAPDAVFSGGDARSGLWATVGPDRMKARGLDEQGLEEYYRSRNLLKARVTARHVANAVLFFATHQTPTTGATIPVDGGLPDATPR